LADYVASLPERAVRSVSALAGGLLNEIGGAVLPASIRRTRLYRNLVEATLRFLVERVGEVDGVFPADEKLAEDFLLRRAAGNGIELVGILTFHASPVWVLAALADLSGAGRALILRIAASLKEEGLIDPRAEPATMNQILDALEQGAGRAADTINTPPLDVAALRREWTRIQASFAGLHPARLPAVERLERQWADIEAAARRERRSAFELSSLMALDALAGLPRGILWLGKSARAAARATGEALVEHLLDHYARTLSDIAEQGFPAWWLRQFRPYLLGAAGQFSTRRASSTERFLRRRLS
jgi:hypothetical protein